MIQWMMLEGGPDKEANHAVERAWAGGAAEITTLPLARHKGLVTIVSAVGAKAKRKPRWPELLVDWAEIYDTKLFPSDEIPVLCEEASGLGADALAVYGEPGLTQATIAWYAKGAIAVYERVSRAGTVAWAPGQPLGRPFDGSMRNVASWIGRKLTSGAIDESLFDRMDNTNRAVGEALIKRALWRMLDTTPPAIDELAGMIANAPERNRG